MCFDFETPIDRRDIGNMKAGLADEGMLLLAGAEMDFPTAPVVRRALSAFAERGLYGFTLPDAPYRSAVCRWLGRTRGTAPAPEMIVPALGTIFALATAVRAFTAPGDGVIVQHPSYYRYDACIVRNGRRVVSDPMRERDGAYALDFAHLEAVMAQERCRLLVLCNPHNPTGRVFSRGELLRVAELAGRYGVTVFSDEIFGEVCFGGRRAELYAALDPAHGISATSLGKSFNFTGVNHANLVICGEALRARYLEARDRDHFGSIDPFFYQAVRAAYSDEGLTWLGAMRDYVAANDRFLREGLARRVPALRLSPLEGSFVAWMDFRALGLSDAGLRALLEKARVCADPGDEYGPGGSGFVRFNLATPRPQLAALLDRLERVCAR